jgi:hypothetical protein
MAFYYDADDYFLGFNREYQPEHEIDLVSENLTLEERQARWEKAPWAYPEDSWLFAPLPSSEYDEF